MNKPEKSPNHALQRTRLRVTAPASTTTFPPTSQVPRRSGVSLGVVMRTLFIIAVMSLCSCATRETQPISRNDIKEKATRLIARREHWEGTPYLNVQQDQPDGTWRVEAHAFDPRHTECGCILFVPGTRREILFSRSGRFISYVSPPS